MLGLVVILHYVPIGYLLISLPINYDPWSYMISIGLVYLVNHVVSTEFAIDIAVLSLYCVILNPPVAGYIVVTSFKFKSYFLYFSYYDVGTN